MRVVDKILLLMPKISRYKNILQAENTQMHVKFDFQFIPLG